MGDEEVANNLNEVSPENSGEESTAGIKESSSEHEEQGEEQGEEASEEQGEEASRESDIIDDQDQIIMNLFGHPNFNVRKRHFGQLQNPKNCVPPKPLGDGYFDNPNKEWIREQRRKYTLIKVFVQYLLEVDVVAQRWDWESDFHDKIIMDDSGLKSGIDANEKMILTLLLLCCSSVTK